MATDTLLRLLLAIAVIVAVSRLVGALFERMAQPAVVGEIVAGIALGPSGLGAIAPEVTGALFRPDTLSILYALAQIGLVFFMFLVGLEIDLGHLRGRLRTAAAVSATSIALPFVLGVTLASTLLSPWDTDRTGCAYEIFLGVAMSITAFPVLARILTDRGLARTPLGAMALTCASVDDLAAWCLLAVCIAVARAEGPGNVLSILVAVVVYGVVMVTAVRPLLARIARPLAHGDGIDRGRLSVVWVVVLCSAVATQAAGIDVIFGGFVAGLCMPRGTRMAEAVEERTQDFVATLLLPLFFLYSGLQTRLDLLDDAKTWAAAVAVLVVAIVGKYVGAFVAARIAGMDRAEASTLGWLLNTRGLTELIVLNVGLRLGVIGPAVFTMYVVMALTTTIMAGPLLGRLGHVAAK